jgi:threonine dehydratase/predicted RNase H-like nuclease
MSWIAGVDGCREGWIAVFMRVDGSEPPRCRIVRHLADVVDGAEAPAIVAVDIPIGLPDRIEGPGRIAEQAVRNLLGERQSSVFSIPARAAVYESTYAASCALALTTSTPPRKVSKQGFMIFPKIREVDALLRARPDLASRVFEVHPEVAFWSLNGQHPLAQPKKVSGRPSESGLQLRRRLLRAAGLPQALVDAPAPGGAGADDYIDALAALVVAREIEGKRGRSFPEPPDRDSYGLPVAIWTLRSDNMPDTMTHKSPLVSRDDIRAADRRIGAYIRRTPVMRLAPDAFGHDGPISLKLEFLQHAGSFKPRGAFNTLLSQPLPPAGAAAASGGNHGAAVAYAARQLDLPARIFVPEISSPAKIAVIRSHGAEVVIGGARYADAQEACDRHVAGSGALRVHPFAAPATIAGQGTIGLEWEAQNPDLDTVLVAVGGGGLIAGLATWWAGRVKVVGVEPEGSRALHAALAAGGPVDVDVHSVAADSLGARNVGEIVFATCRDTVDHVELVADAAITAAQRMLWRDFRIAVEPGGAAALAALVSGAYRPRSGERLGVLLCGANVDLHELAGIAAA